MMASNKNKNGEITNKNSNNNNNLDEKGVFKAKKSINSE